MSENNSEKETSRLFDLNTFKEFVITNWLWFVISVVVCAGLGYISIKTSPNIYLRSAKVLIKEDDNNILNSSTQNLVGLDLLSTSSNLYNEVEVFKSPDLMERVVKALDLNNSYTLKGLIRETSLYGDSIPLKVVYREEPDAGVSFKIKVTGPDTFTLKNIRYKSEKLSQIEGRFDKPIKTPFGTFTVTRTKSFELKDKYPYNILYSYNIPYEVALGLSTLVSISNLDKKTSIIELSYSDTSIPRADDILNTLINEYNIDWIADKNQINEATAEFIKGRLTVLEKELGLVDSDIANYRSQNRLPDLRITAERSLNDASKANEQIIKLNTQIYMAQYLRQHLLTLTSSQTMPSNTGLDDTSLDQLIGKYNDKVIERNKLVAVSGENNPVVKDYDAGLANLRASVLAGIDNQIAALNDQLRRQQNFENRVTSQIASSPKQEEHLQSMSRQQQVKEALYLFFLQKLEENDIQKTYSAYNNRVISKPNGSMVPASPRRKVVLAGWLLLGLFLPVAFYLTRNMLVTTVQSRKEFKDVKIPFVGTIPLLTSGKKSLASLLGIHRMKKKKDDKPIVVAEKGSRTIINESLRILRTNISMIATKPVGNIIAITSYNPGSGKSFVSMNLALTYAFKDKRVAVIDCDMRHGSASQYIGSPSVGLADWLSGKVSDVSKIIYPYPGEPNLNVVPIGKIPPNPTELLETNRFGDLIAMLEKDYDYILLDCPPIDIVADTQIINRYVDRTVFVVRIGLFKRDMIPELDALYKEKRYNNMALVVNGAVSTSGTYGHNGYYYNNK